ncbi:MAG: sialate O-acetylesterase [Bacteroidota bacterium]|nr:sialate O-acetylesterase [Bacteroidota bacterium]
MKKLKLFFYISALSAFADVTLPKLVGNSMVLQRNVPLKIWGWADAFENVTVMIENKITTVQADSLGNWTAILSPFAAGGPYEMRIRGRNEIKIKDILFGDVWLCSGQSNMEWTAAMGINNASKEISESNYPLIRLLTVENKMSMVQLKDISTDGWKVCSPNTMKDFSAVGYFFGRELFKKYGIPIGLISADWGGSPAEVWVSPGYLKQLPEFYNEIKAIEELVGNPQDFQKKYDEKVKAWFDSTDFLDKKFMVNGISFADNNINSTDWKTIKCPGMWESQGFADFDGIAWMRKEIFLDKKFVTENLSLKLGMIDDNDITYFNGEIIGNTKGYNKERTYSVPGKLVKPGKNIITIRVFDTGGGGGISGKPSQLVLKTQLDSISLAGDWKIKTTVDFKNLPPYPFTSKNAYWQNCGLFQGMIAPITNYSIKGVIWYQGESNVKTPQVYARLFPILINDWRNAWQQPNLPFLFAQLANLEQVKVHPSHDAEWAYLREAQTNTLSLTNTGMAVTTDIGDPKDIHPKNKQDVGKRLALQAFKVAYGESDVIASGPILEKIQIKEDTIFAVFKETGSGLITKSGNSVKGFELAGNDKKYVIAQGKIVGNVVKLWNPKLKSPQFVRYNWANNPAGNLYNKEGLPADGFRTDK